jgi:hypothetical protein
MRKYLCCEEELARAVTGSGNLGPSTSLLLLQKCGENILLGGYLDKPLRIENEEWNKN